MKKISFTLFTVLIAQIVLATTYYVGPSGNDGNDGLTPATAFNTVQRAVEYIAANGGPVGNEVVLLEGNWGEVRVPSNTATESWTSNLLIRGENMDVLLASSLWNACQHITFRGFKFKGTIGFYRSGRYCVFEDIVGVGKTYWRIRASDLTLRRCRATDDFVESGDVMQIAADGNLPDNVPTNILIEDCCFRGSSTPDGNHIDVIQTLGVVNITFRGCKITHAPTGLFMPTIIGDVPIKDLLFENCYFADGRLYGASGSENWIFRNNVMDCSFNNSRPQGIDEWTGNTIRAYADNPYVTVTLPAVFEDNIIGSTAQTLPPSNIIDPNLVINEPPCSSGETVSVTGVDLLQNDITLSVNETAQLSSNVIPSNATNNSVLWSSENTSIASVNSNGLVTALAEGAAIITVTTVDGEYTASCNVTVNDHQGGLPSPWLSSDVGSVSAAGSATYTDGIFTVEGSGANIWGNYDEFHYVYQQVEGDAIITARITSLTQANQWTKGGVMMRETLNSNSINGNTYLTPVASNGSKFSCRATTGSTSSEFDGPDITAPYWLRMERSGNTFTGSVSTDGLTWTTLGSVDLNMSSTYLIGLSVSSLNDGTLATGIFDKVTVQNTSAIPVTGISISASMLNLDVGQSSDLDETIEPINATDQSVTWSSDNTAVATVDANGVVSALSGGQATITVTTTDGAYTATCNVTVNAAATNLALKQPITVSAYQDDEFDYKPGENLVDGDVSDDTRWSASGFPQWAEIDLGANYELSEIKLYPYQERAYQYIVEASLDGSSYTSIVDRSSNTTGGDILADNVNGLARYIKITVSGLSKNTSTWVSLSELEVYGAAPATIPVTGVTLSEITLELEVGQTFDLDETISPTDATDHSVTWASDNPSVATVDTNGIVTSLSGGQTTITATTIDGGFAATCDVTVNAIGEPEKYILNPIADAYVRAGVYGDNNYGTESLINVKNTSSAEYLREGYLKFDLSGISMPVETAVLKLYVRGYTGNSEQTYKLLSDNSWTETGITYNNRPVSNNVIASSVVTSADSYIEIDLQTVVEAEAGGLFSIQVTANENLITGFDSREGTNKPELEINASTATDWIEDFSDLADGTTLDNGETAWNISTTGVNAGGVFEVQNNIFTASYLGAEAIWTSEVIDIDGETNIAIDWGATGNMEATDYAKIYYILNGGAQTLLAEHYDVFGRTIEQITVNGSSVQIIIKLLNSATDEFYKLFNISVTGQESVAQKGIQSNKNITTNIIGPNISFSMYPNPLSHGELTIDITGLDNGGASKLQIIDITGKLIYSEVFTGEDSVLKTTLKLDDLGAGMYFVQICQGDNSSNKKLIIR